MPQPFTAFTQALAYPRPHHLGLVLLGLTRDCDGREQDSGSWKELPRHRDEDQVQLDVDRSFIYYPQSRSSISPADQGTGNTTCLPVPWAAANHRC